LSFPSLIFNPFVYTVYFNRRHGRHGHLVDGRRQAKLIEGDSCLLALSRYVHLSPVQVGVRGTSTSGTFFVTPASAISNDVIGMKHLRHCE